MLKVRPSAMEDLDAMVAVTDAARRIMRESGNKNQWINGYPGRELLREDIRAGVSFVITENDRIVGTFMFRLGEEPTYAVIEDGQWQNDLPYGTIHRIGGDGTVRGILGAALDYCSAFTDNIRIDTHADNVIMNHILPKYGFTRTGIIHVSDGSPRTAYQRCLAETEDVKK